MATQLYRGAFKHQWERVSKLIDIDPHEACYIHNDGTTALHLAVMSRTNYVFNEDVIERNNRAPLNLIEKLVIAFPDAATTLCRANTYSPLAYVCLIVENHCDLADLDAMARILLKHAPKCTRVKTSDGLTALDIHIVSYSRKFNDLCPVNASPTSGLTNTLLVRTLLEHDPFLAKVRISKDKVSGAVELLYRSNTNAFFKILTLDDIKMKHRRPSVNLRQQKAVVKEVTKWWVWKWLILLLKYGTIPYKKRGAQFHALQAAAGLVGCPPSILTIAMNAFPFQLKEIDRMYGDDANLPLHEVCAWPCECDSTSTDPVISSRKGVAIAMLVQEYPEAAKISNRHQQTPLELAVSTGTTWDIGVRKLCRANLKAVCIPSPKTGLYPFMTAAVTAGEMRRQDPLSSSKRSLMTHLKNLAKQDLQFVRTIYGLLRSNPLVLINCFLSEEEDQDCSFPTNKTQPDNNLDSLLASVNLDDSEDFM